MGSVVKYWRSLREAHSELIGWENKWIKWYYPYSGGILLVRYLWVMLVGHLIFSLLRSLVV